jgi:hypothetical protein
MNPMPFKSVESHGRVVPGPLKSNPLESFMMECIELAGKVIKSFMLCEKSDSGLALAP